MSAQAVRARLSVPATLWLVLAGIGGLTAAFLPLPAAIAVIGGAGLAVVLWLEPVLALVVMLVLAPLKTLIATETSLALPVDIGQATFALAALVWLVSRSVCRRFEPFPRSPIYGPLTIILAGFGVSLFVAWSDGAWLSEYLKWIEISLLVVIALDLGAQGRWRWIVFGLVLAAAAQALIGLYEFFGGSGAPHLWIANYTRFRAFGTFGQPNPFSAFMGLTLPLALGMAWGNLMLAWSRWGLEQRLTSSAVMEALLACAFYAGSGLLLLGGLLAAWGRGAWLGFGVAALVMVFLAPHRIWRSMLLVVMGGGMVAGAWFSGMVPANVALRVTNTLNEFVGFGDMRGVPINDENFAIVERLAHWQAAYEMASAHPVLGVGLGNYEVAYSVYRIPSWPNALGHAHNDYLNLLAETGLIGLAAYLVGWGGIVLLSLRALDQPDPLVRGMVLGLNGAWAHLAVHSFVDKLYVNNLFLHIGVMLGLVAVAERMSTYGRGKWE